MSNTKISSQLRATFKEWARRLVAKDRAARKYGRSQNTIGEIERALIQAYQFGREGLLPQKCVKADREHSPDGAVDWIEIPARVRDLMWTLSAHFMQAGASKLETEITVVPVDVGGKRRWIDTRCLDEADPHSFSAQVISRSRELGFLETIDGSEDVLGLTPKGVATCEDYWRRWHQQDPTLPLMSLRAL